MTRIDAPFPFSLPEGDVLCAVSGGVDSMCLLELARRCGGASRRVAAAHFHHGLRGAAADRDETFVRAWCADRGIPFFSGRGDAAAFARREGLSVEAAGRRLRYAFLEEVRRREGYAHILTAHHADDNAETVLLNLIRGTGLRGLCGIPPRRGAIVRPLLHVGRRDLAALAAAWGIPHVEDETNGDPAWGTRNRIRREVMPLLEGIRPGAAARMAAAARRLREDEAALSAQAQALLAGAEIVPGVSAVLERRFFESAPEAVAARAARKLAAAVCGGEGELSASHIRAILRLRRGQVSLPGGAAALGDGRAVRILRLPPSAASRDLAVGETVRFGAWRVTLSDRALSGAAALSCPAGTPASVTRWHPRDRLNGRGLKRLCAERGVTPARRDTMPVLRLSGRAAAAPGQAVEQDFAPGRHAVALWVKFDERDER